jgi:hypothetical protein
MMAYNSSKCAETRAEEFVRLWADPTATQAYIRERIGCSYADLKKLQQRYGLPDRVSSTNAAAWVPTEEEIEERRLQCQEKWTQTRQDHETGASRQSAELKTFVFCRRTTSFS